MYKNKIGLDFSKPFSSLSGKRDSSPRCAQAFSRIIFTPPTPGRGVWGRSSKTAYLQRKKATYRLPFSSLSGKRESVHLLPTLYIKHLPLPSTILPIRGTLGLFQGVVSSPTFAIQTSELQLLTTNLRIIFEMTKSKRDGLYL